uniref:Mediator of RNA polymerase II transcription subunit 16 n=1 Tax=Lutzomyia longipalpis TaxID=7200 RepID=A0A1B0CL25_LUTLO
MLDLLFSVHKKVPTALPIDTSNSRNFVTVSSCNIIAFTSNFDLTTGAYGYHCYICDINAPWNVYKVTSNKYPISILAWDVLGKYLLIGDTFGSICIWMQKDNFLSEWCHVYTATFPGECIIKAVFFHNGRKISFNADKKEASSYSDKFQKVKFFPSVRQFGGVPTEGFLVITASGLIGAVAIPPEQPTAPSPAPPPANPPAQPAANQPQAAPLPPPQPPVIVIPHILATVTESLGQTRSFYTTADVCYGKNGHFLIAASNNDYQNRTLIVQCFRVIVKKVEEKLTITSHSLPSFFLNEGIGRDLPDLDLLKLKWTFQEDTDTLIVAMNSSIGGFIEVWGLVEKSTPIHKLFQANKSEVFKAFVWTPQSHFRYTSKILNICTSKLQLGSSGYISVVMADNSVFCLHRDTLSKAASGSLSIAHRIDDGAKQTKLNSTPRDIDVSWMGHLLVCLDNLGQLFVFKSNNMPEQLGMPSTIQHTVSLLEYCIVAGYDYLDILLAIRSSTIDNIVERLSENFNRQVNPIQQFYYVNFLTMKTNLYRLSPSGQSKSQDLACLLMLHSILIAFKSLLRPSDLTCHDKGPAEYLAMGLSESNTDVDKVLLNLEAKDFTVEPSTLQSLQQLIQWVSDLALNILARLPETRSSGGNMKNTGYEISHDVVALNSIRELLVMIRIWGLLKEQCLPIFARADSLDILSTVFRLLTRLAFNPNEPDDMLLDECCLLPSQVMIPQLPFVTMRVSVASPLLANLSLPLYFEYNVEPECLKFSVDNNPMENGGVSNDSVVDSVRHLQLGKMPPMLRKCCRCGAATAMNSVARTAAMKAWEQRWSSGCRCGGFWRLQSYV